MIKKVLFNIYDSKISGTLLFALLLAFYLYFPPQIGLADSADFGRTITRLGLERPYDSNEWNFFNFFNSTYPIIAESKFPLSVTQLVAYIALLLNKICYSNDFFNIFFLSALYYLTYVFGFYLFLKNAIKSLINKTIQIALTIISVIIFSDIIFISYFNSFYQESVFLITGMLIFALLINNKINYNLLVLTFLILSISKTQNLIFLIFPVGIVILKWRHLNKYFILICFIGIFMHVFVQIKDQKQTNEANLYEAVFLGVLLKADKTEQLKILNDHGLNDPNYLKNVGKGYWRPQNDLYKYQLDKEFYSKINNLSILKMYISNPMLIIRTGFTGLEHLIQSSAQPEHLGNLSVERSQDGKKTIVKTFLGQYLNYLLIPIYIMTFLFYCLRIVKIGLDKENLIAGSLLIFIPLVFVANYVAGGINDFVKHNLSVYYMTSILLVLFSLNLLKSFDRNIKLKNIKV